MSTKTSPSQTVENTANRMAGIASRHGVFPDYFSIDPEVEQIGFVNEILRRSKSANLNVSGKSSIEEIVYRHSSVKFVIKLENVNGDVRIVSIDAFGHPVLSNLIDYSALRSELSSVITS